MAYADYLASLEGWADNWVRQILETASACPPGGDRAWDELLRSLHQPVPSGEDRGVREPQQGGALAREVQGALQAVVDRLRDALLQLRPILDTNPDPADERRWQALRHKAESLVEQSLSVYLPRIRPTPSRTSSIFANAAASTPGPAATAVAPQAMTLACPTCGSPRMQDDGARICASCGSALFPGGASEAVESRLKRWEGFLAKVIERHRALMKEAESGCLDLLRQADLDPRAMGNAWQAIHLRALELRSRVSNTWSEKVRDDLADAGASAALLAREDTRASRLPAHLEREAEIVRVRIHADAARLILERARQEQRSEHPCTQCGAALRLPEGCFRALNLACGACGSVNTYEPGTFARQVEHFCAHPLAEEATLQERWAMEDAASRRQERETLDSIRAEERASWTYWRRFFLARSRLIPCDPETRERDVQGRMRFFYQQLANNGTWVRSGARPIEGPE
jgi:uncharacterized Zn finger protein (UPF0148 family)